MAKWRAKSQNLFLELDFDQKLREFFNQIRDITELTVTDLVNIYSKLDYLAMNHQSFIIPAPHACQDFEVVKEKQISLQFSIPQSDINFKGIQIEFVLQSKNLESKQRLISFTSDKMKENEVLYVVEIS